MFREYLEKQVKDRVFPGAAPLVYKTDSYLRKSMLVRCHMSLTIRSTTIHVMILPLLQRYLHQYVTRFW